MPYITRQERDNVVVDVAQQSFTVGQLNYIITLACKKYLKRKGENYTHHNDILGALEAVKQEWYRRYTAKYENKKRKENGDI